MIVSKDGSNCPKNNNNNNKNATFMLIKNSIKV